MPSDKAVNVACVPQRSPFRYPGGKTWFVPRLRAWLSRRKRKPQTFIEPFAGGGVLSLTSVCEDLAGCALMAELDDDVAAVWKVLTRGDAAWLAGRILGFRMNRKNAAAVINGKPDSVRERAFRTIVRNRCLHGGILAAGCGFLKNGESGKGILSRWYPETLAKRLMEIHRVRSKLAFRHTDAFEVLNRHRADATAVFFIDPPYTAGGKQAGKRLYTHCDLDHDLLFHLCAHLRGDFIMTYDNAEEVKALAGKYALQSRPIPMKNTHHADMTELVIGRNLDWMERAGGVPKETGRRVVRAVRKPALCLPPLPTG